VQLGYVERNLAIVHILPYRNFDDVGSQFFAKRGVEDRDGCYTSSCVSRGTSDGLGKLLHETRGFDGVPSTLPDLSKVAETFF